MRTGKGINKDYVRAEEGLIDAINFHKQYHARLVYPSDFNSCTAYPCRMIRDDSEFYGAGVGKVVASG